MKEFLAIIQSFKQQNKKMAIARVIKTWGSSPRPIGSTMIISEEEEMAGSVSGGCVENSVIKKSKALFENGHSEQLNFGVSDEEAWAVGLSCGGKIEVFLQPFFTFHQDPQQMALWYRLESCLSQNDPGVLITLLENNQNVNALWLPDGSTLGSPLDDALTPQIAQIYQQRKNAIIEAEDGRRWFVQVFPRQSQLLIIGAAHITADLIHLAKYYDFAVTVIDPRGTFAHKTHFPTAPDKIIEKYPSEVLNQMELDAYTFAVVLSHDPKIDDNALHLLLPSEVAYIGALGSKRTQAKRVARLQDSGFSEEQIAKIHAPVGMDINAKTPREIALSIMGEIIKVKNEFV